MNMEIIHSELQVTKEQGYVGKVAFRIEGHKESYEITLHSKDTKNWGYSLHFLSESGDEKQLIALDEQLDEDDELYKQFIQAVMVHHQPEKK